MSDNDKTKIRIDQAGIGGLLLDNRLVVYSRIPAAQVSGKVSLLFLYGLIIWEIISAGL
ncbi:MAG: hypothetical protein Q7S39_12440 [Ignavibacteria bacterium]|nr:hypothetical protein [Ignavibacteria bacterium]